MRLIWSVLVAAACAAPQTEYAYQSPNAPERKLTPVRAEVVYARRAETSGLPERTLSLPFVAPEDGNVDGTELVESFLSRADIEHVRYISDLAIYLQTTRDGRAVECRSDVVPETYTETVQRPARYELVSEMQPVQRQVTEYERRCRSETRYESKMVTEYQQRCRTVSKPVQRTRTVYRSQYDFSSKSTRSVPHTEHYTAYESKYECTREPVTRYKSQPVTKQECKQEPVTRTVTRYEHQLENRYVPARFDQITRQRLRELDPQCYVLDDGAPGQMPQNRVEGRVFGVE
jgi:hypothetical protein